jgi:hypothetical protein
MARIRRRIPIVEMPGLDDLQAIERGFARVRVALSDHRIDSNTARVLRWGMQMSVDTLLLMELQEQAKSLRDYQIRASRASPRIYRQNTS